jgi:predicted metalloprotease
LDLRREWKNDVMTKIRSRDASRIQDVRGSGGGGGGLGGLGGMLGGGRGGGMSLPGGGGLGSPGASPAAGESDAATGSGAETCSTDLEQTLCGAVNDVSEYWIDELPQAFNRDYQEAPTVFFSDAVGTGCGQATSQTGPFYCPADGKVYFDLEFLTVLQNNFGAQGDLAAQYIVAHEYGHHVQNLLGINEQMRRAQQSDPSRGNQYSVALELQADCLAGAWARSASDRNLFDNPQEVEEALNAAAAVGDDRIQQKSQGRGSSAQRVEWFQRGFQTADPTRCTTFSEVL